MHAHIFSFEVKISNLRNLKIIPARETYVVAILLNLWGPPYGLGFPDLSWAAPQMSGRVNLYEELAEC